MVKTTISLSLLVLVFVAVTVIHICHLCGVNSSVDAQKKESSLKQLAYEECVVKRTVGLQCGVSLQARPIKNSEFVPKACAEILTKQLANDISREIAAQIASDKNQVMDALLSQPQIPADYGETMIALFRDPAQDVVTRDFAVQHIGLYAQALNRRGQYNADSADAANCRNALFDAASETSTIVAAAAFRALADVSEFDPRIDARRLDNALARCASDETASLAVRVMAVQLCGERKVKNSESAIKTILDAKSAPEPLRRAASHAQKLLDGITL